MMIAHPPCTHLCIRGAWHSRRRGTPWQIDQGFAFVMALFGCAIPKICIENPVGIMNTQWRRPDQIIHPHEFGHRERKTTCLWLKNLPPLFITMQRTPEQPLKRDTTTGKRRYSFDEIDTIHGREKAAHVRSITFQGVADAMSTQWGEQ